MKEIFGQYGGCVIAVLVALALFAVLRGGGTAGIFGIAGNSGIFGAAGSEWNTQSSQENDSFSCEKLDAFYRRKPPVICYRTDRPIRQNSRIRMEDHFQATDEENRILSFEVVSVTDAEGVKCEPERTEDGTYLTFEHAGVCRARFFVRDGEGRNDVYEISFPVQEE